MRKIFLSLFLVFALIEAGFAQSEPIYTVEPGDTLWWLEGFNRGDPSQWHRIVEANPFLKEKGRIYKKGGKTIGLIRPGEQLQGLVKLGILPQAVPLSELQASATTTSAFYYSPWFGLLLILLLAAVAYAIFRSMRWRFLNPITSGRPVVENGIPPSRPRDLESRFQQIAERRYGEMNPTANLSAERPIRISEIERGELSGNGVVQYSDRRERRRLRREPAYRARFRFHDGHEEFLYFLQACANDVTFSGARYVGFEWTSLGAVVGTQPARETGPVPLRVAARSGEVVDAAYLQTTTLVVSGLRMVVPEGASIRTGENGEITIAVARACDITIGRVQKAKVAKKAKPVAPAATAS